MKYLKTVAETGAEDEVETEGSATANYGSNVNEIFIQPLD